ncbi:hypothetical protein [Spirosoma fluviale]|uniref:Uncharacterized protein n=1 Tax=Spirosoma fluviale TaxID=1597977 RepID=A0A286GH48_9BACT|nr:hypothetical protein [Spirosoma fluviale]SOD94830.1 hypothetical protein SAMN06269250_4654 [Spirosoma fluviale]
MPKKNSLNREVSSLRSPGTDTNNLRTQSDQFTEGKPTRQPDWLLIFVIVLFLISLMIVWLVDVPSLLR